MVVDGGWMMDGAWPYPRGAAYTLSFGLSADLIGNLRHAAGLVLLGMHLLAVYFFRCV
jgi:hypothetical protein